MVLSGDEGTRWLQLGDLGPHVFAQSPWTCNRTSSRFSDRLNRDTVQLKASDAMACGKANAHGLQDGGKRMPASGMHRIVRYNHTAIPATLREAFHERAVRRYGSGVGADIVNLLSENSRVGCHVSR